MEYKTYKCFACGKEFKVDASKRRRKKCDECKAQKKDEFQKFNRKTKIAVKETRACAHCGKQVEIDEGNKGQKLVFCNGPQCLMGYWARLNLKYGTNVMPITQKRREQLNALGVHI